MKKNITQRVKLSLVLIYLCVFIMHVFIGCSEIYTPQKNSKIITQLDKTKYILDNFDEYKSRVKDETGFEGRIVTGNINGKEQKYIEFDIDNATKIKFIANSTVIITKQFEPTKELNWERKIEMNLFGMGEDSEVRIALKGNGSISCDYKANDLGHPLPNQKEKDEGIDYQIKLNISTEELEELSAKAHSIYNVFEEICKEYNEKDEK